MTTKDKWNRKHEERLEEEEPPKANGRLVQQEKHFQGGLALDLACGLGGNSFWLARHKYQVEAYDLSEVAIGYISNAAAREKLSINAKVCDLTALEKCLAIEEKYDVVVITYYLNRSLFPIVRKLLKEGGYFFMETYYDSEEAGNMRISSQFQLQPGELLREFADWKTIVFEEDKVKGIQTLFCQKQF